MKMVHPSKIRDAEIESATPSGDVVRLEMKNGNMFEMDTEAVIKDWLLLHKKLVRVRKEAVTEDWFSGRDENAGGNIREIIKENSELKNEIDRLQRGWDQATETGAGYEVERGRAVERAEKAEAELNEIKYALAKAGIPWPFTVTGPEDRR